MTKQFITFAFSTIIAIGSLGLSSSASGATSTEAQIKRAAKPQKQVASTDALSWRFIGPMTGNRGSAVVGHPTDTNVFFHGAANGLWKTTDAG